MTPVGRYDEIYNCILFMDMEREHVRKLLLKLGGRIREYKKGEFILSEKSVLQDIGILLAGEACKVQYYPDGTEQMVQKLKKAYMVGLEVAMSPRKTSPYTIYAAQPCEVFWFPARCIEEAGTLSGEDRINLYRKVVHFLANEDIRKYRKIELLSIKGVREKILRYLELQGYRKQSNEFEIDFNREELSNYLGINRSVLSHELKNMERDGLLTVRKNHFCLKAASTPKSCLDNLF